MFRIVSCLVAVLTFSPVVMAQALSSSAQPVNLDRVGIDQKLNTQVPLDLQFRDEAGRQIRLGDFFGKRPVFLSLVYYDCPMLCTYVLNGMAGAFRTLSFNVGNEFEVVTVSINPAETPALASAKKKVYLKTYGRPAAAKGWHFLTGEEPQIKALADAVGFRYTYDPESKQFAHAAGIMLLTPQGRLSRYFYGVEYPPRDLRLALVEASSERIGSPVDHILLYCMHYDPTTGKYGVVIMRVLRLAGLGTLAMLVGFVGLMAWRGRRRTVAKGNAPEVEQRV
jgi:protein SCO1/2